MTYNICMSFFSLLKRNKESYSLVLNISSGSISGGIIKFTNEPGENIIYYSKEQIPFQQDLSINRHYKLMFSSLGNLIKRIRTDGLKKIPSKNGKEIQLDKVYYIFSSPWSTSQTKIIRLNEKKSFKVTTDYINKKIDELEKQFQIDVSKVGKIIEKKVIQVIINGYPVTDYENKLATNLEIAVFFTIVPEDVLQSIETELSKVFNIKNSWCHSSALSIFSLIRNLFPQNEDFIYIEVSEEITDVSVIKDNVITSNVSIPMGRNNYIRELSGALKVTPEIVDSMISIKNNKSHDELANLKLSVTMDAVAQNWLTKIFDLLEGFKEKIYVPENLYLITSPDLASFLQDKLKKRDFKVTLVDNKKIKSAFNNCDISFKLELMFLDNLYKI